MNAVLEPSPERRLAYAFARKHGVLVRAIRDGAAEVTVRESAEAASVAEVRRFLGLPLKLERVADEAFEAFLQHSYETGSNAAAEAVEGLEEDTDLAHLAEELGRRWGLPVAPLLARRAGSRRQRGLGRSERQANVQGAFRLLGPGRPPGRVALVDDVYTTGATVSAAAAALLEAGAEQVEVVTLARAVR